MTTEANICTPEEVLRFWFEECCSNDWFRSTPALDEEMRRRFRDTHLMLAAGVPDHWHVDPASRLAAIIVLDQFPRNIYRGTPLAFATDGLARQEAEAALACGADRDMTVEQRTFMYIPFEHSETLGDQERSVSLFRSIGDEQYAEAAIRHHELIAAYGRFPHRNAMLGRTSTEAELIYLSQPGAGF